MAQIVYLLEAFTSLLCSILLLRGYARGRRKLLLWSGLCFAGLAVSGGLVFVDLILLPTVDLFLYRLVANAISMAMLLYGLIWESQ
ncbi:MAG TPA: DUF5985 family protein [Candidatus Baltobacteraceae bacterium]|jgi:hypothetical protein|nr:DUF5985 family protein [Candidatus Baltobacteraceae bacterium]